eukprot:CAMPEP_0197185618 /NCGR_PEP_ID=MMETSP1423-20130617/12312_1 /TAXON_ID=476441 /ORGANISM="Pseudo-nitzschia heimii, Strain UNC1101" /LENGTH=490 /DNA_ID=CAMNT_0042636731 /DNA_START=269 /DNA_END=1741 /DNA_ORIENTATION=-
MPPSTSRSVSETNIGSVQSSSNATVPIDAHYNENQQHGGIHAGSNLSSTTATTQHHHQPLQTSPSDNFPTFSSYARITTANHGITNSSITTPSSTTGSPAFTNNITNAKSSLEQSPAALTTTTTTTATATAAPHHIHFAKGEGVKEPLPTDVICGRGKMTASHPANRRFRELVDSHKASYQNSKRRDEKTRITCELVDKLRAEGRFVLFDPNTKLWYEVSEEYAREKVSHSLRSRCTSAEQRNATNANNSFRMLNGATQQHEQETVVNIAPRTKEIHGNGYHPPPAAVGTTGSVVPKTGSPPKPTTNGTKPKSKSIPGSSKAKATNGALNPRKLPAKTAVHKPPRSKHSKLKPGLDEVVRRLIQDQQALLRTMIQKETERFTSAAAMALPPRPMPLSFKAEASAVSTLTDSLPKMGNPAVPAPVRPAVPVAFPAHPPAGCVPAAESTARGGDAMETGFSTGVDPDAAKTAPPNETASSSPTTTIATVPAI